MKNLKKALSLLIALSMLSTLTFAADPAWPCKAVETQRYSADPWTRTLITDNQYGLKYFNDSSISGYEKVFGDTTDDGNYQIHNMGATFWNVGAKYSNLNVLNDAVNFVYRGKVVNSGIQANHLYSGVYMGNDSVSTKKFSISFQTKLSTYYENYPVVDIELFNGDNGAYSSSNLISGKSGHNTRKNFMLELRTDGTNAESNPNAASMFHGTHVSETGGSAIAIEFDNTDWHYVEAVVDVTNGKENATVTLYFDGKAVYTKTGDIISDNAFDANGNFCFNAMLMTIWSNNKQSYANIDNVKIVDLTSEKFGIMDTIVDGDTFYYELTNTVPSTAAEPVVSFREVGTNNVINAQAAFEGKSAIKVIVPKASLKADTTYSIEFPDDLTDVTGRPFDTSKVITYDNNIYGTVWENEFEHDASDEYFSNGATHTWGGMTFSPTSGSYPRHYTEYEDALRGFSLTTNDLYKLQTQAFGSKSFDNDISGKKLNFSFQTKLRNYNVGGGLAVNIQLAKDGVVLAGPPRNGNDQPNNLIYMEYDHKTNPSGKKGSITMWNNVYATAGGKFQHGLSDDKWHQIDVVADATAKTLSLYVDGALSYINNVSIGDANAKILDGSGNITFDQLDLYLTSWKVDKDGTTYNESTNAADTSEYQETYLDNLRILKLDGTEKFCVSDIKQGKDVVYAVLSATVASGQTVPQIKLKKVGTDDVITPTEVKFEGSQAIKLDLSGLALAEGEEYELVYPAGMNLADINGRTLDAGKAVSFVANVDGVNVIGSKFVKTDDSLIQHISTPVNRIKGVKLTFDNAPVSDLTVTMTDGENAVATAVSGEGNDRFITWDNFLDAKEYTLTVKYGTETVYTHTFTPTVSEEISISDFGIYDEEDAPVLEWADTLRGQKLFAKAQLFNATGENQTACIVYAIYEGGKLLDVKLVNDASIANAIIGEEISVPFTVGNTATSIKSMLWKGIDTLIPLAEVITLAK